MGALYAVASVQCRARDAASTSTATAPDLTPGLAARFAACSALTTESPLDRWRCRTPRCSLSEQPWSPGPKVPWGFRMWLQAHVMHGGHRYVVRSDGSAALETAVWSWSLLDGGAGGAAEAGQEAVVVDLISAVHLGDGWVAPSTPATVPAVKRTGGPPPTRHEPH